jgi:hypothetical protein
MKLEIDPQIIERIQAVRQGSDKTSSSRFPSGQNLIDGRLYSDPCIAAVVAARQQGIVIGLDVPNVSDDSQPDGAFIQTFSCG